MDQPDEHQGGSGRALIAVLLLVLAILSVAFCAMKPH